MTDIRIGVIGGSGFYQMEGMSGVEERRVQTPFGETTEPFTLGTLEGQRVAFLPRHGAGHRYSPTELPQKAAIWAFKEMGVEFIISVSAVGSLRERIAPLHLVVPDQLIDRTRGRSSTFFERGIVAHIGFADPFCPNLAESIFHAAVGAGATAHKGGTLVVIEGPAFSTRAESELYRQWGADIIGMTALPEAKLAREAEMCYATLACCTDYDVWHQSEEDVTVELIVQNLLRNVDTAKQVVRGVVQNLPRRVGCPCINALESAIITSPDAVPLERKQTLRPFLSRYMPVDPETPEGEYRG
jgi:5'-methylthioadenosine phosphorylase